MTPKEKKILSVIAAAAILAGGLVWVAKYRQTPPPSPSPQGGGNETANWKTYRNTGLGYSIQYPQSWRLDESGLTNSTGKLVQITPPDREDFADYISIVLDSRSLEVIKNVYSTNKAPEFSATIIRVGGQTAYKYEVKDESNIVEIYIPYKGQIYAFSSSKFSVPEINQALSTFKFIK